MTVRAKFVCESVTQRKGWQGSEFLWSYEFQPARDDSEENKKFWQATPSGSLKLDSIKSDLFTIGESYYLDFTPASVAVPA